MKTTREKIEVMEAAENGKIIQARALKFVKYLWSTDEDPIWDWAALDYRIKPEPKVIWVNEYDLTFWDTPEEASDALGSRVGEVMQFKQVMKDES